MAKARAHKSQHYVPQTYMSAWCDPAAPSDMEPYVWLFEKNSRVGRRKAPKNILEETDFYTLVRADGERDLTLEQNLCDLEGRFAEIRRTKLEVEEPFTREEGAYLAAFVVAMSFRTKAHREHRRGEWKAVLEKMHDAAEEHRSRGMAGEIRWVPGSDVNAAGVSYDEMAKLAANPVQYMMAQEIATYLPLVGRMQFMVVRTDDDPGFITSDDPCVWIGPNTFEAPPPLGELGEGEFGILMPLSPKQLLFLNPYQSCYGKIPARLVDVLNGYTWRNAHEYYIARRNETHESWFSGSSA